MLRYSTIEFGAVQGVIKVANDLFWAEGPSGGHYQNIADNQCTQLGCGFGINGQNVTYTTEFR